MVVSMVSQSVATGRATARPERRARAPFRDATGPTARAAAEDLPRSIRRAAGLEDLSGEAITLPSPARTTAAVRAFAAGNGYLPGLIVNRLA